jgi:FKBP-type peptidyl-prolyl cis-trans isomerase
LRLYNIITFALLSAVFCSCRQGDNGQVRQRKPGRDELVEINSYLVQKDREVIESYAERKGLKLTESPTGLWYSVIKPGTGNLFTDNDVVVMNYECDLLDGTRCYSSDVTGPKEIIIGKTKAEQGLNEGLKLLRPGGEALFIIPPHLGFGLLGDGAKIPARAIIIYRVRITDKR